MRSVLVAIVVLLAAGFGYSPWVEQINHPVVDAQFRLLRTYALRPVKNEVVVVGFDENTGRAFREPLTLWHPHFGRLLEALAGAGAAAVGLDVVLPDRSYDSIVAGYDKQLLTGILAARRVMPLVLALTVDATGKTRPVYPAFVAVAGKDATGYALLHVDADGVVRRFTEHVDDGETITLAGQLARRLGRTAGDGLIDFAVGERFNFVPLEDVLAWSAAGDAAKLDRAFKGRVVLVGGTFRFEDRLAAPVNLAAWEPDATNVPGVLLHAQVLRNLLNDGLIAPISPWIMMALCLVLTTLWLASEDEMVAAGIVVGGSAIAGVASTWVLTRGMYVPLVPIIATITVAAGARAGYEATLKLHERLRLRGAFKAYVSPQIMQQILHADPVPGLGGERHRLCVLFADIRGFTARSESMSPEAAIRLLNRYFSQVTASIHGAGGTVDKFIGDGIMAFFGAPQRSENPSIPAVDTARDMLRRIAVLNVELAAQGEPPIDIGIGLHTGDAVVGNVGSETRHNYTAIGDTVNVASRLEGLTKDVGYPVVCSETVFNSLANRVGFVKLGPQAIKGHTPVEVYGWRPDQSDSTGDPSR
jgi:class 3 adenylate cyclase/CHASE2 domain-containing sensor protein